MKTKTKSAAAKGESVDLLNFKFKTEKRLDLMSEWMEHIRFTEACPLPRSPGEIVETEMELEDLFEEDLERTDTDCSHYQLGVVKGRISALRWVLGETWDNICN